MDKLKKTKEILLKHFKNTPHLAIITGSGIKLFENKKPLFVINYTDLPVYSDLKKVKSKKNSTHVKGHEGKIKLFNIQDKYVLVYSGRRHLYEGLDISKVIINARLTYELGIKNFIVTNAAGGINKKFNPGDLMLIDGFIDLMQASERGVICSIAHPPYKLRTKLNNQILKLRGQKIKQGIYAGVIGPSYDTFGEISLLSNLGADAVGMSTIPELICAKSLGINFAGISIISNVWKKNHKPSHKDVLHNVSKANKNFNELVLQLLK
ncbi:MAG: purine-nucleoside phosphorylase [Candidatus Melainabacteria bacterium]|nr:purine-nucleoside phosphorylase [Candidatus Melainabacteria bacterium]MBI3308555.1 purine-nucleoside phosphorylase [Candidatus Melainabacteria bacterium]